MEDSSFLQSSFLGGEWNPAIQGRYELPQYRTGMNVCRNGFPIEEGSWIRRSGTRYAAATLNGAPGRVIPFAFSQASPYLMEFTDGALRMFAVAGQTSGLVGPVPSDFRLVTTNDNQQVSSISTANPAVVQTGSAHGWTTGDQVQFIFAGIVSPDFTPALRARVFSITVIDTTHFSIASTIGSGAIDGSTLGWSTPVANTVVVTRILKITTPYTAMAWSSVRKVQAEKEAYLLQGSYSPYALNVLTDPTATNFSTFSLAAASFIDGPYYDPPTDGTTLTPSGTSGSVNLTASAATSINGGSGFITTDIGRSVRILSEPAAWASGTTYALGDSVKYNGTYFTSIQGSNTGYTPDAAPAWWGINTAAAAWSWAVITAITSTTIAVATIKGATLVNTNAAVTWRMGLYSNTTGWPTCGAYYEGRIWLSGVVANRVDSSKVNSIANGVLDMTPTATDGTVADNNGISYIFNSEDTNPLFWMIGGQSGIVCGTQAGEWLINAPTTGPITPTNIQAHRGTTYGCENIEPEHTELTVGFVQRHARKILEYFPDVFSGRFIAPNLSTYGKHLSKSGIAEIRYQSELLPVMWARMNDLSLAGVTYKRSSLFSSQPPDFMGWHRHDLGSGRKVESIAVGPSMNGELDNVAMVTNDTVTNIRHVELMTDVFEVNDPITHGWFLDDAVVPTGGTVTVIAGVSTLTLYGLWHLNGKTVTASVAGLDCGDYVVSNGAIAVPIDYDTLNPDTLTTAYLQSVSDFDTDGSNDPDGDFNYASLMCKIVNSGFTYYVPAVVGFTYTSQGQILRPDMMEPVAGGQGPGMGKYGRISQFAAYMCGVQGISFSTDFQHLRPAKFRSAGGTEYPKLSLFTGIYRDTLDDNWSLDGMICWQVSRPYPATVMSLTGFMRNEDK